MKWIALMCSIALQCACTTPTTDQYNRRDLYSPAPPPDSHEAMRQMRARPQNEQTPAPKPQFR